MNTATPIFDRRLLRRRRDRSSRGWDHYNFLHREAAERLAERLEITTRPFARALDFGCRAGELSRHILKRPEIEQVVMADLSPAFARAARRSIGPLSGERTAPALAADEETLPFADGAFDLAAGCLGLHAVNDLPGALIQLRRALRPDGMLLASLFGGATLGALRAALTEAEIETYGGAGPRVAPFTDIRDAGSLLQRAGFIQPVVDDDTITVTYDHPTALMHDLRGMGETNVLAARRRIPARRSLFARAAALYADRYGDGEGHIAATFHILTLTAWTPAAGSNA